MGQSVEKTVKGRSPLYPIFSINEMIDFVKDISKIGGKRVSIDTIASVLRTSVKTNSFKSLHYSQGCTHLGFTIWAQGVLLANSPRKISRLNDNQGSVPAQSLFIFRFLRECRN